MPKVYVDPTIEWNPEEDRGEVRPRTQQQHFTMRLMDQIPDIVAGAMHRAFGEEVNPKTVVPRLAGPTTYVCEGTPDIDVTVRPSWTEHRWQQRDVFRRELHELTSQAMLQLRHLVQVFPQVDFDVDFITGGGFAMTRELGVGASWPDRYDPQTGL